MRSSKAQILSGVHAIPTVRFCDHSLTSTSGLVLFQMLFDRLDLRNELRRCCRHLRDRGDFKLPELFLVLVIHILLGYRKLDDIKYYRDDPVALRAAGLRRFPDDSTLSRRLRAVDVPTVAGLQSVVRQLVIDRLRTEQLRRVTLDFDGSVCSTRRRAEGTAVGYNNRRKGERSYYPLLCTVAQSGQILDVLARSGNVHDSNGSEAFIHECVTAVAGQLPSAVLESRLDSAFFSENTALLLDDLKAEYTISVPFERLTELKRMIEERRRWRPIDETWSYFEMSWCPKAWSVPARFVFLRQKATRRQAGPLQLDLFEPKTAEYQYKVIVTNKTVSAQKVMQFHHGRGSQEGIIGEAKSAAMLDYVPTRSWAGNQMYMQASILAHNLTRELQMQTRPRAVYSGPTRPAMWAFEKLETLRNRLIWRAGRLHSPDGRLTLTMSANAAVQADYETIMSALREAA